MNCQNFENALDDLTRGALMDARLRETALAHRDSCRDCAARLADESALRAGLRSLAARTSEAQAPPRVEAALLAAFRAQAVEGAGVSTASVGPAKVSSLKERPALKQWTWVKSVATAATVAAAILLMIIPPGMDTPVNRGDHGASKTTTATKQSESPAPVAEMIVPPNEINNPAGKNPIDNIRDEDELATTQDAPKSITPRVSNAPRSGRMMATTVGYNTGGGGRGAQNSRGARGSAALNEEIVTDFIPLLQGGARLVAGDGGQVVRVELPRTALERFGLPMNVERANERVKADVLLGEDGMARAIRFVR
jgi:hypothetical protein